MFFQWLVLVFLAVALAFAAWGIVLRRRLAASHSALSACETRFATVFDSLPAMAWIKDADGRFLAVNQALVTMCGAAGAHEMIGRTDYDLFPRDMADAYRHNDALVRRRMSPMLVLEPCAGADGVVGSIKSSKTPVLDAAGRCVGTLGVSRQLLTAGLAKTALGQAADALRASEARFRTMVDALPAGVLEIDRDGSIVFASDLAWSLLGLAACRRCDGPWVNLLHADDRPAVIVALRKLRATGEVLKQDVRLAEETRSATWLRVRGVRCRDIEGATLSLFDLGVLRHQVERQLSYRPSPTNLYDGIRAAAGD